MTLSGNAINYSSDCKYENQLLTAKKQIENALKREIEKDKIACNLYLPVNVSATGDVELLNEP